MSLKEKLMDDLKLSMKNKDKVRKDTITMIRAAIKQKEVDERIELSDEQVLEIISKQLKEKNAAIEEFKKGARQDLVDGTQDEINILLDYLPKQLTQEEVEIIVKELIADLNITEKKDIGILMKAVMPKVKGKTDGKIVNKIAQNILN